MKQIAYFLLSFVLLFSACKKDEDITDPDESQKDPVEDVVPGDSTQTDVEEKVVPVLTSFVFEASKKA